MRKSMSGFTIVELLVVIVVIAILASISMVAFNGVQQRARDSQRKSDIATIQKVLAIYYSDKGGYPACNGGVYKGTSGSVQVCTLSDPDVTAELVPNYMSKTLVDPRNTSSYVYNYALGYKLGADGCASDWSSYLTTNYVIAVGLESVNIGCATGWFGDTAGMDLIVGSQN